MKKYGRATKRQEFLDGLEEYKKPVLYTIAITLAIMSAFSCMAMIERDRAAGRELATKQQALEVAVMETIVDELEDDEEYIEDVNHPTYQDYEYAPRSDEYYEELELLARAIHCENGSAVDGEMACWKTGSVIVNRVWSDKYPNTIEGVVYQPGQYDCLKVLYREEPTDIEYEVAASLMQLVEEGPGSINKIIPENVVYAAEFRQGSGLFDKEGRTMYCYE